jgi:hypothetical protein
MRREDQPNFCGIAIMAKASRAGLTKPSAFWDENRVGALPITSFGKPGPVSLTLISASCALTRLARIVIRRLAGAALASASAELRRRLNRTCSTWTRSAITGGRYLSAYTAIVMSPRSSTRRIKSSDSWTTSSTFVGDNSLRPKRTSARRRRMTSAARSTWAVAFRAVAMMRGSLNSSLPSASVTRRE